MINATKQLGLRIKRLREERGLTQNMLSSSAGVSLKHLGELERGRGNPSLRSIERLACGLGVSIAELFNFEVEEKSKETLRNEIHCKLKEANIDALRIIHRALNP